MFTLIRMLSWRELLITRLPALVAAFVIAEMFYKFHSFVLETGAFLVTWYVIDGLATLIERALARPRADR